MSRRATWIHPGPRKSWACSVTSTVSAGRPCSSSPTTRRLAPPATGSSGCVTGGSSPTSAWRTCRLPHDGQEKADLMHAIYDRITVAGPEIVGVRLTQAAYAHGLALALPEKVELARPTGLEPATFGSGTQRSIH